MNKKEVKRQVIKRTGCGNLRLIEHDNGSIALNIGKNGSCAHTWASAFRELLNELVENNVDLKKLGKKLEGSECFKSKCCVDIVGAFLQEKL